MIDRIDINEIFFSSEILTRVLKCDNDSRVQPRFVRQNTAYILLVVDVLNINVIYSI